MHITPYCTGRERGRSRWRSGHHWPGRAGTVDICTDRRRAGAWRAGGVRGWTACNYQGALSHCQVAAKPTSTPDNSNTSSRGGDEEQPRGVAGERLAAACTRRPSSSAITVEEVATRSPSTASEREVGDELTKQPQRRRRRRERGGGSEERSDCAQMIAYATQAARGTEGAGTTGAGVHDAAQQRRVNDYDCAARSSGCALQNSRFRMRQN